MKNLLAILTILGFGITAQAQTLLYEWNFTNNVTGTLTNMPPGYAVTPGTGNLVVSNILGSAAGTLAYFTNGPGTGPGISGPGGSAAGAYVCAGQSYGGGGN